MVLVHACMPTLVFVICRLTDAGAHVAADPYMEEPVDDNLFGSGDEDLFGGSNGGLFGSSGGGGKKKKKKKKSKASSSSHGFASRGGTGGLFD